MATPKYETSAHHYQQAIRYIPGGVNSPVRAFRAVGGTPIFIKQAYGSRIIDVDGNEYIDYVCSWGPLILGHAHPAVVKAINQAAEKGTSYGAPTEQETLLAQLICEAMQSVEMVRLVNSGTEAVMAALRLARAFTNREKIVKFAGCYHGHYDGLLVKAGSGSLTLGMPDSPGITAGAIADTVILPYNNLDAIKQCFAHQGQELAAVIVEPVAGNMGVVLPEEAFLKELREITKANNALLIFDEVITGFRVAYGGAQAIYNIDPDLTTLGKIIGGGLPVGAYGGRTEIMQLIAPSGLVYQAGTLSGNPLAVASGLATLQELNKAGIYEKLDNKGKMLEQGLWEAARQAREPVQINRQGSMLSMFFTPDRVYDYTSALNSDVNKYARFFHNMLNERVYLPPSQFEAMFVSLAHTDEDIEATTKAAKKAMQCLT